MPTEPERPNAWASSGDVEFAALREARNYRAALVRDVGAVPLLFTTSATTAYVVTGVGLLLHAWRARSVSRVGGASLACQGCCSSRPMSF